MKQPVAALVLLGFLSCSAQEDHGEAASVQANAGTLDAMLARQQQHRQRLDELSREIAASELKARQARLEAEFLECRALQARIDSDISLQQAKCASAAADFQLCRAENAKKSGQHAVMGCLGGIALALWTGGSAAPLALGGCGVGLASGEASAAKCDEPKCASDRDVIETPVLAEHGLTRRPLCGGDPGFEVAAIMQEKRGVAVDAVGPGSTALAAGLAPGDTILELNGSPIESCTALTGALAGIALASATGAKPADVHIKFVRNGTLYKGRSLLKQRDFRGQRSRRPQLGVTCIGSSTLHLEEGTKIAKVERSSPAAIAGLREGDVILAARDTQDNRKGSTPPSDMISPLELEGVIDSVMAGKSLQLTIQRGARDHEVELVLGPRHKT